MGVSRSQILGDGSDSVRRGEFFPEFDIDIADELHFRYDVLRFRTETESSIFFGVKTFSGAVDPDPFMSKVVSFNSRGVLEGVPRDGVPMEGVQTDGETVDGD